MKKCIIMIVAMLLWSMAGIQAQRTYVLSVGVAHYQDNSHDLRNPDKDAIRVKELFAQHSVGKGEGAWGFGHPDSSVSVPVDSPHHPG